MNGAHPKIGNLAPAFELPDQDGNAVSLKSFKGKKNVLLYFYPAAMTPGCTVQACGLRDSASELAALATVVLGISPDPVGKLRKFIDKQQLNFTLLSDTDHAVALRYGAWGPKKFMGRSFDGILRSSFLIGKDGRPRHVLAKVNTKSHHDDVLKLLREMV